MADNADVLNCGVRGDFPTALQEARGVLLAQMHPDDAQPVIDALERIRTAHNRRVSELLAANNREVERRRKAEAIVELARDLMRYAKIENRASDRVFVSKERAHALNAALTEYEK